MNWPTSLNLQVTWGNRGWGRHILDTVHIVLLQFLVFTNSILLAWLLFGFYFWNIWFLFNFVKTQIKALRILILFLVHLQLSEWIKTSSAELENVSKALCEDISKHCRSTRYVISDVSTIRHRSSGNGFCDYTFRCLHIKILRFNQISEEHYVTGPCQLLDSLAFLYNNNDAGLFVHSDTAHFSPILIALKFVLFISFSFQRYHRDRWWTIIGRAHGVRRSKIDSRLGNVKGTKLKWHNTQFSQMKLPYQIFCVELTFLYFKIGPVILVPHVGVLCLDCSIENNETANVEHWNSVKNSPN